MLRGAWCGHRPGTGTADQGGGTGSPRALSAGTTGRRGRAVGPTVLEEGTGRVGRLRRENPLVMAVELRTKGTLLVRILQGHLSFRWRAELSVSNNNTSRSRYGFPGISNPRCPSLTAAPSQVAVGEV